MALRSSARALRGEMRERSMSARPGVFSHLPPRGCGGQAPGTPSLVPVGLDATHSRASTCARASGRLHPMATVDRLYCSKECSAVGRFELNWWMNKRAHGDCVCW